VSDAWVYAPPTAIPSGADRRSSEKVYDTSKKDYVGIVQLYMTDDPDRPDEARHWARELAAGRTP